MKSLLKLLILATCLSSLLAAGNAARAEDMVLSGLRGDVTTNEYQSFIDKLRELPPPPTNNIGNAMVYEWPGARLHGLQTFYSFSHDRRVLDVAVVWSDAFLKARNDPVNGRIQWTGKRELCWPNKETNDARALYSGAENGDVIEHIVATAKLILEDPSLWTQTAPADKFGFGATYLERAKTYVTECQRSSETTIVPWYVRSTKDGYRLVRPDTWAYMHASSDRGPLPWNQQQCVTGGLLRLAQCHRLLKDGNTNIAYYEKITGDAADWFFSEAVLISDKGVNCYDWAYDVVPHIDLHREDTGHAAYDMYIMRAYAANLGPTQLQMQRLANTAVFAIHLGSYRFGGYVNGDVSESRPALKYLNYQWIEMSVLDRQLYELLGNAVLVSHEYYDNIPVQAAVLYAKHYWSSRPAGTDTVMVDNAKGVPPLGTVSRFSPVRWPTQALVLMIWAISETLLNLLKRSKGNAVSKDRNTLRIIWLVNLVAATVGIYAALRMPAFRLPWREVLLPLGYALFALGLALRWYAIFYLGRFITTNVAITADHRVIDTGPYRFIRHPSYTGSLLALLGMCLTFLNWASLLIILVPACAVTFWRIHIEEQELTSALGQAYIDYSNRTKRLIPMVC